MNNFKEHIFNCKVEVIKAVKIHHQSDVKTSLVQFFNSKEGAVIEGYYTDSYIELVRYLQKLMSEGKSGQEINNLATLIENYGADIEEQMKNNFFNDL